MVTGFEQAENWLCKSNYRASRFKTRRQNIALLLYSCLFFAALFFSQSNLLLQMTFPGFCRCSQLSELYVQDHAISTQISLVMKWLKQ